MNPNPCDYSITTPQYRYCSRCVQPDDGTDRVCRYPAGPSLAALAVEEQPTPREPKPTPTGARVLTREQALAEWRTGQQVVEAQPVRRGKKTGGCGCSNKSIRPTGGKL